MGITWFASLFNRSSPPTMRHAIFGEIVYSRHDGWTNNNFKLWGFEGVALQVDAGLEGPDPAQEQAFESLEKRREHILPRCLEALEQVRSDFGVPQSDFVVTGLSIPSFQESRGSGQWTLWFDLIGDDHFMYGIQTDDDWKTLDAFADD